MPQALVPHQSPEDHEYARVLAEIEVRTRRVAELQADLAEYKEKLGQFNAEYHTRVGALFVELDRLALAIAEYEFRIAKLRDDADAEPDDLERETKEQFTDQREQIHADEEETRYYEREHQQEQKRPELDEESTKALKAVYRELAKRFHPDLAKTDDERQRREAVMKQVNAAFHERDMNQLRSLGAQHDIDDAAFAGKSIGEKLVWAIREVSRLDELIESIQDERATLEEGDIAILWGRHDAGEPVLERLEVQLRSQLDAQQERLEAVILEFRHLIVEVHGV